MTNSFKLPIDSLNALNTLAADAEIDATTYASRALTAGIFLGMIAIRALPDRKAAILFQQSMEIYRGYFIDFSDMTEQPEEPDDMSAFETDFINDTELTELAIDPALMDHAHAMATALEIAFPDFVSKSFFYYRQWQAVRSQCGEVLVDDTREHAPGKYVVVTDPF